NESKRRSRERNRRACIELSAKNDRLILSRERAELIDLSAWQSDRMLPINMGKRRTSHLSGTYGQKCLRQPKRKSRMTSQSLYHSGVSEKIRV
ncbi:hypothetical protein, partial [Coprococcus comes]|uniref:hypothetical protein n=1 Tax=Coprococcus comes TaxID=410072 RepID=UPI003D2A98B4